MLSGSRIKPGLGGFTLMVNRPVAAPSTPSSDTSRSAVASNRKVTALESAKKVITNWPLSWMNNKSPMMSARAPPAISIWNPAGASPAAFGLAVASPVTGSRYKTL